jgi:outer membrane murein-binding lipoprotein Lpp
MSEAPVALTKKGITLNWKFIIGAVAAVLAGGGGTAAGVNYFSECKAASPKIEALRQDNVKMHEEDRAAISEQRKTLKVVTAITEKVLDGQNRQVAREEARRLTEGIKERERREREYDRLYDLTLGRLQENKEPCRSIDCQE